MAHERRLGVGLIAIALLAVLAGCQQYANSTPATVLETDDAENYERVFRVAVPRDVDVIHSVVVTYAFRMGVVTTDDWAFEVLAPRGWVERQSAKWRLVRRRRRGGGRGASGGSPPPVVRAEAVSAYDAFVVQATSVPTCTCWSTAVRCPTGAFASS